MFIIGIDPGKTGAIVIFRCNNDYGIEEVIIEDNKTSNEKDPDRYTRIQEIASFILDNTVSSMELPIYIMKEKTNAMPKEGVSSARTFGWQSGIIDGIVSTIKLLSESAYNCKVDIKEVRPQQWRKEFIILEEKGLGRKQRKENNYIKALMLFPVLEKRLQGTKGGIKDGRVDALLIAEFNRRVLKGLVSYKPEVEEDIDIEKVKTTRKKALKTLEIIEDKKYKRKYYQVELSRAKKRLKEIDKSLATIIKMYNLVGKV